MLLNFIKKSALIEHDAKYLLSISGGVDSMVLLDLFRKQSLKFIVVHFNHNLRSDAYLDEDLVRKYCSKHEIEFICQHLNFDSTSNLQEKARLLRYEHLGKLKAAHSLDKIVTAHHADDVIETFFINLLRGSGINGLSSIPAHNDKVIRPLLDITKQQILSYAESAQVPFREDQTNTEKKYLRNRIRNQLIPAINAITEEGAFEISKSISRLKDEKALLDGLFQIQKAKICRWNENVLIVQTEEIKKLSGSESFLFYLIRPFGFSATQAKNLNDCIGKSGKEFLSISHQILVERNHFELKAKQNLTHKEDLIIHLDDLSKTHNFYGQSIKLSIDEDFNDSKPLDIHTIDFDKITFPLSIRQWQAGDKFQPKGMNGQTKKLKKFFTDQKISNTAKLLVPVLTNADGNIISLIGYRDDFRFVVDNSTKKALNIIKQ